MKRFVFFCVVGLALVSMLLGTSGAQASVLSKFIMGVDNLGTDNSAEIMIDRDGTNNIVTQGDLFIGGLGFNEVSGGGITNAFGTVADTGPGAEFSGLFAYEVAAPPLVLASIGGTPVLVQYTMAPLSAGGLTTVLNDLNLGGGVGAEILTWSGVTVDGFGNVLTGPNSTIAMFDDPTPDWNREMAAGANDDGNVGAADVFQGHSADVGTGPFANEAALLANAIDGTKLFEFGFTGQAGESVTVFINTIFGGGVFAANDMTSLTDIGAATLAGSLNFWQNNTVNNTSILFVPVFDPATGIASDIRGNGGITTTGGRSTPFDNYDNVEVTFHPIPEPGSSIIWSVLGLAMFGWARARRRR